MILSISEILELTNKIFKKKEQIEFLRRHDSLPLRGVLKMAFDPSIEWLLPPGAPPYKPNEALDQEGQLHRQANKLMVFIKGGGYDDLRSTKREALFISFLESLTPGDAEMMTFVKDKMINFPDITPILVQEAFPGLLGQKEADNGPLPPLVVIDEEVRPPDIAKKVKSTSKKSETHMKKTHGGPPSTSGFRNVYYDKRKKKWSAKRVIGQKQYHLGYFDDPRVADMAVEVFCKEKGIIR